MPELGHGDPSLHGAAIRRILLPAQSYVRHRITKYPLKEQVAIAYDKLMKTKHYVARDKALAARYPFVAMPSRDDEGWLIVFPDIPGVVGFATTWDAIGVEAQNILGGWFDGEAEDGHPSPAPTPEWNPVERQPGDYSLPTLYSTKMSRTYWVSRSARSRSSRPPGAWAARSPMDSSSRQRTLKRCTIDDSAAPGKRHSGIESSGG